MPVQSDLAGLIQDAEVHGAGVQGDPAVKLVWGGGEAPEVASSPGEFFPVPAVPRWYAAEGASISINPLQRTGGQRRVVVRWSR
jgi:hypothetical protein